MIRPVIFMRRIQLILAKKLLTSMILLKPLKRQFENERTTPPFQNANGQHATPDLAQFHLFFS